MRLIFRYNNTMKSLELPISGMHCQGCANRLEKVLRQHSGVLEAQVNFASESLRVRIDEDRLSHDALVALVASAGFSTTPAPPPSLWEKVRLLGLLLLSLPFVVGMVPMLWGHHHSMPPALWQWGLATVAQFILGWPFYRGAWQSLRGGVANMDVLITLGTWVIYAYSCWHFVHGNPDLYFEAGVMILAFVSAGKFLEARSKRRSLNALGQLLALQPQQVQIWRENQWQRLPLAQVQVGDKLQASVGERIGADGRIVQGQVWTCDSHLSGEPGGRLKQQGDRVLAGELVEQGSVHYVAEQVGKKTQLFDMMAALREAQGAKAPVARLADKVVAVFVPVVLLLALGTLLVVGLWTGDWGAALTRAVAVLVIACPCALGLATPAAVMAGMGRAYATGVWFKDPAAIEAAATVDAVVFDKTGTLTLGRPQLQQVVVLAEAPMTPAPFSSWLELAATLAQHSAHPLAKALLQAYQAQSPASVLSPAQDMTEIPGQGISATVAGVGLVQLGSATFTQTPLSALPEGTVVTLALNGRPVAVFSLADTPKPDALATVQALQAQGLQVHVLSGDRHDAVQAVVLPLGIRNLQGDCLPRDKVAYIQQLQSTGHRVAMVGDGVNDAPALAIAHASFAIRSDLAAAEHSASATLMQASPAQLLQGLAIAKATMRTIRQNLFFAFFYNALGIPMAMMGLLSPGIAGAAMAASSLSVLFNALRLRKQ